MIYDGSLGERQIEWNQPGVGVMYGPAGSHCITRVQTRNFVNFFKTFNSVTNHHKPGDYEDVVVAVLPTLQISSPPSPPTPTILDPELDALSTARIFLSPFHTLKLATALLVLRRSQSLTTPSYEPVIIWESDVGESATDEGVDECINESVAEDRVVEAARKS